jgi:hypothetical protein
MLSNIPKKLEYISYNKKYRFLIILILFTNVFGILFCVKVMDKSFVFDGNWLIYFIEIVLGLFFIVLNFFGLITISLKLNKKKTTN